VTPEEKIQYKESVRKMGTPLVYEHGSVPLESWSGYKGPSQCRVEDGISYIKVEKTAKVKLSDQQRQQLLDEFHEVFIA
jgi:hypothetical protein